VVCSLAGFSKRGQRGRGGGNSACRYFQRGEIPRPGRRAMRSMCASIAKRLLRRNQIQRKAPCGGGVCRSPTLRSKGAHSANNKDPPGMKWCARQDNRPTKCCVSSAIDLNSICDPEEFSRLITEGDGTRSRGMPRSVVATTILNLQVVNKFKRSAPPSSREAAAMDPRNQWRIFFLSRTRLRFPKLHHANLVLGKVRKVPSAPCRP